VRTALGTARIELRSRSTPGHIDARCAERRISARCDRNVQHSRSCLAKAQRMTKLSVRRMWTMYADIMFRDKGIAASPPEDLIEI
jgi:hypothetical protein